MANDIDPVDLKPAVQKDSDLADDRDVDHGLVHQWSGSHRLLYP